MPVLLRVFIPLLLQIPMEHLNLADYEPLPTLAPPSPSFGRPQLAISSYSANASLVQTGKEFKLNIGFDNKGTFNAVNVQAVYTSADVIPTNTGGLAVLGPLTAGGHVDTAQTFIAVNSIYGKTAVIIDVTLTYYDDKGIEYTDKFTLTIPANGGIGDTVYPTSTPTGVNNAQLVITSYASTVDPLQPGEQFQLGVTVQNMGNTAAKNVTMIVGGGSSGTSGGTPQPGGVSGSSGEFTNFAPVGSSNIQSLGDIPAGGALQVLQNLVVNVSTNPGAYPMKITFSYVNNNGEVVNDDQVITLLVYSLPNLDVSFYSPPETFFTGQPGALPIQVVNLGKRSAVLGNMKIETADGTLDPSSTLVGSLDPGGYFTFDSILFPDTAGSLELNVTIEYTDDFNQPRTITRILTVTVEEAFIESMPDPALEGSEIPVTENESFLRKVWRFALGLFGLDSAPPANETPVVDPSFQEVPNPIPAGGGKGG
ncbi:MAG: hypothetical protein IPN58_14980 [Anaerolineales bacterium]|nr:hypothetical protein [Anaerolineales bacterium]